MVRFLGYGTVAQFDLVCNSYDESLLLIVDHTNVSEAHVFCYGTTEEKKIYMKGCNRICNLFARHRKSN